MRDFIENIPFFKNGVGEVDGMFSLQHLAYILMGFIIVYFTINITKNKSDKQIRKYIMISSIVFTILEILKIIWNINFREEVSINDYLPLYFCSMFIYGSLLFSFYPKKTGRVYSFFRCYMYYGCLSGGVAFLLFPTTALEVFPLFHVLSIHSLFYHSFMLICALWSLRFIRPSLKDFKPYAIGLLLVEVVLIIVNFIKDTNFMMLNHAFSISILEYIESVTKNFYPLIMAIGQLLVTFFGPYIVYKILVFTFKKKKLKNN